MNDNEKCKAALENSLSYQAFSKSPEPSFKHTTYFHAYDALLSKYRGRPVTFVEIGVFNGGSLFMWREFLGPEARIIGIDLNPEAKKWEEFGFEIYIGSQQDPVFWDKFCEEIGKFDVVLDDGGHTYLQQIITAESLLDNISDGGILIVEDTHTSYMDNFGDKNMNFINYVTQCIHKINSRFGRFESKQDSARILSLQVFESIVAFHVDRKKSLLKSEPIWNRRPLAEHAARDYRHEDKSSFEQSKDRINSILSNAFAADNN